jgi:Domain of Unknown Function (DUF1080)
MRILFCLLFIMSISLPGYSQTVQVEFGTETNAESFFGGKKQQSPIRWINVNTDKETWSVKKAELSCSGHPIGVMRSEKQYENFMIHVEWKHLEAGGNSGVFVWSSAVPGKENRLPDGVEVQMLDLEWVRLNTRDSIAPPIAYVHGELFGVGGVETIPDNPRGTRSRSVENRCLGTGEWNTYDVICVDGVIKLSVNGKFVNGISKSSQKKGYLCLESEGAPILFRNFTLVVLPSGVTSAGQTAPEIKVR